MPFNYLACSIKGTAFSEYSSLLLITREMNSMPGGASIPNATPLPKHTLCRQPPPIPHPGPRRALCGCGRHVNHPSGAGKARPAGLRLPPCTRPLAGRGRRPAGCSARPANPACRACPRPPGPAAPPVHRPRTSSFAALSALIFGPQVGEERRLEEGQPEFPRLVGSAGVEPRGRGSWAGASSKVLGLL